MLKIISFFIVALYGTDALLADNGTSPSFEARSEKIKVKTINGLMIAPVSVNGIELLLLVDTGSSHTLIFGNTTADSIVLKNIRKINIQAPGKNMLVDAYETNGNILEIGKQRHLNKRLYLIYETGAQLSYHLGSEVHGILGGDILSKYIVELNYTRKLLWLHPANSQDIKCNSPCFESELRVHNNKPHIMLPGFSDLQPQKMMLIDSGNGDAVWVFDADSTLVEQQKYIIDFLGRSLSDDVYGKRFRHKFWRWSQEISFEHIILSVPDVSAWSKGIIESGRDGSIGAEILKRFKITINYPNRRIYFKKNRSFDEVFRYNIAGIGIIQSGNELVSDYVKTSTFKTNYNIDVPDQLVTSNKVLDFFLVPEYTIDYIRPNSTAERIGLKEGDKIVSINNRKAYRMELNELYAYFFGERSSTIKIKVVRKGVPLLYKFELQKEI
ncbi:MAG: aspartyl protease family protein [Flavobacteriaceae bacterium]|nr:aspartyl protease family protein [Flavobacteriaceae bacterium]